jgi:integrase
VPRRKPVTKVERPKGLVRRGERAYWHRRLPTAVGGDRVSRALECAWGTQDATVRAHALNTFWDRGDWIILRRWASGDIHISRLVRSVREGDYAGLRKLNADGVLLGNAIAEHLGRTEATRSGNTRRNHGAVCTALLEWPKFGPDFPMHTLTTTGAEEFLHAPRVTGEDGEMEPWAPRTQRAYKVVAGALWGFVIEREAEEAEAKGLEATLRRNPWKKARIKEARRKRPQVMSEAELVALLRHPSVWGTPACALLALGGLAGLRMQEATNLRLEDDLWLDEPQPFVRVQSREGEDPWDTKTERSEGDVEITPELVHILREHIRRGYCGSRFLFTGQGRDTRINPDTGRDWTRAAFAAAGIRYGRKEGDGLTHHSLRHTHATILLSKGASIATVAERLRDTQGVVLETYSHALPNDRERVLLILREAAKGLLP